MSEKSMQSKAIIIQKRFVQIAKILCSPTHVLRLLSTLTAISNDFPGDTAPTVEGRIGRGNGRDAELAFY